MTPAQAIAEVTAAGFPLTEAEVHALLTSASKEDIELVLLGAQAAGRGPDRTHWQLFAATMRQVSEYAAVVSPILEVVAKLAPLV